MITCIKCFQKLIAKYIQMVTQWFKVLIYGIFQNFEKKWVENVINIGNLWLFRYSRGPFEALFEHETAIDFQKVYPILRLIAVECFHSSNQICCSEKFWIFETFGSFWDNVLAIKNYKVYLQKRSLRNFWELKTIFFTKSLTNSH